MITILSFWGRAVRRWPLTLVVLLVVATAGFGAAGLGRVTDTELTAYAVSGPRADALLEVHEDFGVGGIANKVQVVVDAGPGGDVITAEGLEAAARVTSALVATPEVAAALPASGRTITSFALPAETALAKVGIDPAAAGTAAVDAATTAALADPAAGPEAARLFSLDLDASSARARAGLVIVTLDAALDPPVRRAAGVAARDAVDGLDLAGFEVSTFSFGILSDDLGRGVASELPLLLLAALALIVVVIGFAFRRVSDVVVAVIGLLAAVVWTIGIGVILGPDVLGVTGYFTSIANAVPVLLVGLGVDFAVQLTYRYREERILGLEVGDAAATAIATVGMALILATVTTAVGFLTNLTSPVGPIRDFGVLTAAGIGSALVVMVTLVPAMRVLLGRRSSRHVGRSYAVAHRGPLVRLLRASTWMSRRIPVPTLLVALTVAGIGVWNASAIPTSFSQEAFMPRGSDAARAVKTIEELFGGNVTERTFLVARGDLARPGAVAAMAAAVDRMADDPEVVVVNGEPVVESPLSVLRRLSRDDAGFAAAAAALGWTGSVMESMADVAAVFDLARAAAPAEMGRVLGPDDGAAVLAVATTAGDTRLDSLVPRLTADAAALVGSRIDVVVTSDALVIAETNEALTESQGLTIVYALGAATALLILHFWIAMRRPLLGLLTMVSTGLTVAWILGTMHLLGLSFNVLTVTIAAVAVGIGVDYAIHMTHRFTEEVSRWASLDDAIGAAVTHTGSALAISAATTAIGFGVLTLSGIEPIRQFGAITALTIVYAFLAAVLVQPAVLRLWVAWQRRGRGRDRSIDREADHAEG